MEVAAVLKRTVYPESTIDKEQRLCARTLVLNSNPFCPLKSHLRCHLEIILNLCLNISRSEFISAGYLRTSNMLTSHPLRSENAERPKIGWKPS